MKKYLLLLAIIVVRTSCFATPEWVANPYVRFAQKDYICGVGSGSTQMEADFDAQISIASYFGVSVVTEKNLYSFSDIDARALRDDYEVNSQIRISQNDIVGIVIDSRYIDSGVYFSHAALNRSIAIAYYQNVFEMIQARLFEIKRLLDECDGSLFWISYWNQYCDEYVEYQKCVRIINALSQTELVTNDERLEEEVLKHCGFSGVPVSVDTTGEVDNQILGAVTNALCNSGLIVVNDSDRNIVKVDLRIEEVLVGVNPNKFIQYDLRIEILNTKLQKQILLYRKTGREGQKTLPAAKHKACFSVCKLIQEDFSKFLTEALMSGGSR